MSFSKPFFKENPKRSKYKILKYKQLNVEGLIGVGKTSFLYALKKYLKKLNINMNVYEEPIIPEFRDLYIKNQAKYAFVFQVHMRHERLVIYQKAKHKKKKGSLQGVDRSLEGDQAFEVMQYREGHISEHEHQIYNLILNKKKIPAPDVTIFLNTNPKNCLIRILKRNIESEKAYTLEYLEALLKAYEETLDFSNCIKIDWDDSKYENGQITDFGIEHVLDLIVDKIITDNKQ